MREVNLLKNYPKTNRDLEKRSKKTKEQQEIARRFDREFFDGSRDTGYGGFNYNIKYWDLVVKDFIKFYNLNNNSSILDVGCGKGFMLYDFKRYLPNAMLKGVDISSYAIENSLEDIKKDLVVGDCKNLPFEDNSFDLVISINTIHNHEISDCQASIREINRVSKNNCFIIVDAYKNDIEKEKLYAWNLTAKTILHTDEWINLFKKNNYSGDFYWFSP